MEGRDRPIDRLAKNVLLYGERDDGEDDVSIVLTSSVLEGVRSHSVRRPVLCDKHSHGGKMPSMSDRENEGGAARVIEELPLAHPVPARRALAGRRNLRCQTCEDSVVLGNETSLLPWV